MILTMILLTSVPVLTCFTLCMLGLNIAYTNAFGAEYPVTAAWFKDRYTARAWNGTLSVFAEQGGDTVLFQAPPILLVSKDELEADAEFQWCGDYRTPFPSGPTANSCFDIAETELSALGLNIVTFAKYGNEEDYDGSTVMRCPMYDSKIVTSRVYYRLVLPYDINKGCDLNGTDVMVLFTVYSGIDPHALALQTAENHNMSVYLGLPQAPKQHRNGDIEQTAIIPYIAFLHRVISDNRIRYSSNQAISRTESTHYDTSNTMTTPSIIRGYYSSDEFNLVDVINNDNWLIDLFKMISNITRQNNQRLVVGTYFQTNIHGHNSTLEDYISAFRALAESRSVDVISVKDGRGSGTGAYFWPTEVNMPIQAVDPGLEKLLRYQHPSLNQNVTYSDVFWTSVQRMFARLGSERDSMAEKGYGVDMWLNIEAFDYMHDDPCLPVDHAGSGLDEMLNPVSKSRIDWALTATGPTVQKVASFAWDPSFTCITNHHKTNLAGLIRQDLQRPIIANCSFHSPYNRSVVLIGYNLAGQTQGFKVDWPGNDGKRHQNVVYGYYFELDWGSNHHRLPSLMYTQLYDPYDVTALRSHGYVKVAAMGAYHPCIFTYDFRNIRGVRYNKQTFRNVWGARNIEKSKNQKLKFTRYGTSNVFRSMYIYKHH